MAETNITYTNPDALAAIGRMNPGTSENPNIGPVQGAMQGQAWNQMQQFVEMAKQSQQMGLQHQGMELSDFAQQQPSRNFAAMGENMGKGETGQTQAASQQMIRGRLVGEDQLSKLQTQAKIQDEYRNLDQDKKDFMIQNYPFIKDSLGANGEATDETGKRWDALVQQHNAQASPDQQIAKGSKNEMWLYPTSHALTSMALVHGMAENDPKTVAHKAIIGAETTSKLIVNGQEIEAKQDMHAADLKLKRELTMAEIEAKMKGEANAHRMGILQEEAIQARAHFQENLEKYNGDAQKAVNKLSSRERAIVNDETFQRIFPRTMIDPSAWPMQQGQAAQARMEGTLKAVGQGNGPQVQQPSIPNANFGQQPKGQGMSGNIPPPKANGELRQFKEGWFKWNGSSWVPTKQ